MADAMLSVASLSFAESYAVEDDVVVGARARARELGCTPIGPAGAATLRVLAAAAGARAAVEVVRGVAQAGQHLGGRAVDQPVAPGGDLVFVDADPSAYEFYFEQALRLLRPGGIVAFDDALWHDRVADPAQRDPETSMVRELGKLVRDDPRLLSTLLPVSNGLLVGVKR